MIKPMPVDERSRAALVDAAATLATAMQSAQPYAICQALRQQARVQATLLELAKAEHGLQQALRWAEAARTTDLAVDVLCDLCDMTELWASAEDQQSAGSGTPVRERMRAYAYEAGALVGSVSDPAWEVQVLLRLARTLTRCGDKDDAELLQARAARRSAGQDAEAGNPHLMPGLGRLADS